MRAVDERQSLETLQREEKTASRALSLMLEKDQGLVEKRNTRLQDLQVQSDRKTEASDPLRRDADLPHPCPQLLATAGREDCKSSGGVA